jgi:hypothetical protein
VRSKAPAQHTYVGTDVEDSYFPKDPGPDVSFAHQSMTEDWPADWNGTFDLVHSRFAMAGSGTNPMQKTVERLTKLVKTGGYIQLVENVFDEEWPGGSAINTFQAAVKGLFALVTANQNTTVRHDIPKWLREAGMEDVKEQTLTIPIGATAKNDHFRELSTVSMVATATGVSTTAKKMPSIGVSPEALEALPGNLEKQLKEKGGGFGLYVITARKP